MPSETPPSLQASYERRGPLLLAGLRQDYTQTTRGGIPAQWRRFAFHLGAVPGQVGRIAYGAVVLGPKESRIFGYMTAVEVAHVGELPASFTTLRIAATRYAVFRHSGNVISIHETVREAFHAFGPQFERRRAAGVELLERYGEAFDPESGEGGVDILIPLTN